MASSSSKPQVQLIPWDPTSSDHVQRMVLQRIACGWDDKEVENWRERQESGNLNLQWIILADSSPSRDVNLDQHTQKHPQESTPLLDSALSFGGKPRTISQPQKSFIPIGHICLGLPSPQYEPAKYGISEDGLYCISIFYISRAIQGGGLGRAAMDMIEGMAISEPLNAKTLTLNAINKIDPERDEKYKALGLIIPPFSNQEWYERRGYKFYKIEEKLFSQVDGTGKRWYWDAVFLKKEI